MDRVQFVTSNLLSSAGVKHGWFMRFGGVSEGLFESLNGKKGNGDSDANVGENRKRALAALCHPGLDPRSSCNKDSCLRRNNTLTHIIHEFKTNILESDRPGEYQGFDASIATNKGQVLSQTTADCGTVIIASASGSVVALAHGSWHTLKDKIVCDVVAKVKKHTDEELVAGLGPMICKDCFEFGPEATELFDSKYIEPVLRHPARSAAESKDLPSESNRAVKQVQDDSPNKYLVNLKQMIIDQLQESGVTKFDDVNICTFEDERFFSHRRSGAGSGRLITLVSN